MAWHERHVTANLARLVDIRDKASGAGERVCCRPRGLRVDPPRGVPSAPRRRPNRTRPPGSGGRPGAAATPPPIEDLVAEATKSGDVREDVAVDELAIQCVHSLSAASSLATTTAVGRLVALVLIALRPSPITE